MMKVKCPAIYKHFKHSESGELNNYLYVTIGISNPIDSDSLCSNEIKIKSKHTESGEDINFFKYKSSLCHLKNETSDVLVVYKSLYDNDGIYARSIEMFTSEVDHSKYPEVMQQYRFELYDK